MTEAAHHRGANPRDITSFTPDSLPTLCRACSDYCWLLTHDYSPKSALKLVGDRYQLTKRQRTAVFRFSCSDSHRKTITESQVSADDIINKTIAIDGFNILITIEAALSNAYILKCRDNCYRDISEVYSNYRIVKETQEAILLIGKSLEALQVKDAKWLIDKPVSNSGRTADLISKIAKENGWQWETELIFAPDKQLIDCKDVVVSTDGIILQNCEKWFNLPEYIIKRHISSANLLDLT